MFETRLKSICKKVHGPTSWTRNLNYYKILKFFERMEINNKNYDNFKFKMKEKLIKYKIKVLRTG